MGHGAFTHPFVKVNVYKFRYNSDVASACLVSYPMLIVNLYVICPYFRIAFIA